MKKVERLTLYHDLFSFVSQYIRIPPKELAKKMNEIHKPRNAYTYTKHLHNMYEKEISHPPWIILNPYLGYESVGYITVIVKTWGSSLSDIAHVIANILVPEIVEEVLWWFLKTVFKITATVVKKALSIVMYIVVAILTAPPVGGSWVDCVVPCMTEDPSGTFAEILEDEDTIAHIEAGIFDESLKDCERNGYNAVYGDPIQIVYTIMHAIKVYKSPNNHYFYYRENLSGAWVVEVEILQHERCGRVVTAYKVDCTYMCNGFDCSIYDSWALNDNFILMWSRS